MATKKNYRPRVSARKRREEQKLAQRRAFYQKYRKQLIIGAIVAVVALILLWLAIDYFVTPDNSLRTFMGQVLDVKENAIVRELNGRYYEFGAMDAPEGYQPDEYDVPLSGNSQEQNLYFITEDESKAIESIYVAGVKERTGEDMIASLTAATTSYSYQTEARKAQIAGYDVNYMYGQASPTYDDPSVMYSALVMYVDTIKDSSILVQCSSGHLSPDALPTEEAMLAEAEAILSCLTLP